MPTLYFIPYTEINLKWIKDVNVRAKSIKFLEDIEEKFHDMDLAIISWI